MDRCRYPSKPCLNARAVKLNGELHRFCEQHRRQANQNQMRWSKRKQTVLRVRRGGDGDGDGDDEGDELDDQETATRHGPSGDNDVHGVPSTTQNDGNGPPQSYQAHHALHLPPPPPHGVHMGPMGAHGFNAHNVNAAGASLSHLSLTSHNMNAHAHAHAQAQAHALAHAHAQAHAHGHGQAPNGGMISSFHDHRARGGAIPSTSGVNLVLGGGAVRRELAPAPPPVPMRGSGVHVPPIQTALPPLLPPRAAADQPDPTAVHALLMLERAANVVSSSSSTGLPSKKESATNDDDEDAQVRRELKRAKSNEWVARPTLSPAGLPTVTSLATHGMSATTTTSSTSASSIASVSSIGRSASWQPPTREEQQRESLGQWMQRKQASLPSLSNITRIEKRPYESISSSAPAASSSNSFLHRGGPENSGVNSVNQNGSSNGSHHHHHYGNSGAVPPQHHGSYHVPLHSVSSTKPNASSALPSDPTADSSKRSALV